MILALVSAAGLPALAEAEPNSSPASNPASAPLRPSIAGLATGGGELPIIHAVARSASGKGVRLEFSVTGQAEPKAFVLADPDRVIVDLPETIFRITAQGGARAGGPAGDFRFGLVSQGRSRIVIDLTRPARIAAARYEALADKAGRIVLELEAVGRERFMELARAGQAAGGALAPGEAKGRAAPARSAGRSPGIVVVIDPGHGGIDSGAVGASRIPEKDITLSFARTLAEKLNATGRYEAILTRDGDVFVPLGERVRMAREAGAKLFVSIHADTLNERSVNGATVYTLSERASDAHAARLAAKENLADKIAGHVSEQDDSQVGDILADLTRRETRTFSHVFARSLVAYWKTNGRLNKNPVRSAGFTVLRAHDVPSVLLEMGYLSSARDAAELADPLWRAKSAAAVVKAIDSFFAAPGKRQAQGEGPAGDAPAGNDLKGVASAAQKK